MIRIYKYSVALLFLLLVTAMACTNNQKTRMSENKENVVNPVAQEVLQSVNDSLNAWLASGIEGVQFLKTSVWRVDDAVVMNSEQDKGFLLLLNQDKDPEAELDYVQVLYVIKKDGKWVTYLASLPNIVVARKKINGKFVASTLTELAEAGHQEINSRYINSSGIPDDQFINQEYTPELEKNHQLFLSKKIRN